MQVVRLLANSGADINAKDARGYTALNIVAQKGRLAAARYVHQVLERAFPVETETFLRTHVLDMVTHHQAVNWCGLVDV